MEPAPIYVETLIRGPLEEVWRRTQSPDLHERWDLRFTHIEYLPRGDSDDAPQRFLYATHLGFGLRIEGRGESVGSREGNQGERTSALRFWSDDPKSLIYEGSGYWRYVPEAPDGGVRFLTGYNYRTRFGLPGRLFDRLVFRPLMAWATAWSFDRLRLWIEQGIDPAVSMQRSLIHAVARSSLTVTFLYHGLVPKLLFRHRDELAMLADGGVPPGAQPIVLTLMGLGEVVFGLALLTAWRTRWLSGAVIAFTVAATLAVALRSPDYLIAAFNPATLNLLAAALAVVGLLSSRDLPSAARCRRRPPSAAAVGTG